MNRGAAYQEIFISDVHRFIFLDLMSEIRDLFGVECHAYCLMGNHYHLLIHTPRGNLGRGMRHLSGIFTQRFNRLDGRDGPLFRGRYKAIIVDADNYLLQVSRYIHRNPIEAQLVDRIDGYAWSSYGAYVGREAGPYWLYQDQVLGMAGGNDTRKRYQAYVEQGVDEASAAFYGKKNQSPIFGDELFREQIRGYFSADSDFSEIPEKRNLTKVPSIEIIMDVCACHYGVKPEVFLQDGRRGSGEIRTIAIGLCRLIGGHSLKEIGTAFGGMSYMGVSSAVSRVKKRREKDNDFNRRVSEIEQRLKSC
ncbi:MAG: hypothetical protein GY927_19935 [bacterium]|nr:hypothetical protein [bacterium]